MADGNLTEKRERFVEEFIIDLNGTQAAIRAGYSIESASQEASRLLSNVNVQEALAVLTAKRAVRTGVTQDKIIRELAKIAFADITDFAEWDRESVNLIDSSTLDRDDTAAISEISTTNTENGTNVKLKLHPKLDALQLLMRHNRMLNDKLDITGKLTLADIVAAAHQNEPTDPKP